MNVIVQKLPDPAWGEPRIARIIPNDDSPWGAYHFLVGTDWEPFFPRVQKTILDQALRGYATPLMKILGPPPRAFTKRLPVEQTGCSLRTKCTNASPSCVPGAKTPDCWETSAFRGAEANLVNGIVMLWRDGIVVVVEEEERSLNEALRSEK